MRWQLNLEEFSPELIYIKGSKNVVPDALSRLIVIHNFYNNNFYSNNKVGPTL